MASQINYKKLIMPENYQGLDKNTEKRNDTSFIKTENTNVYNFKVHTLSLRKEISEYTKKALSYFLYVVQNNEESNYSKLNRKGIKVRIITYKNSYIPNLYEIEYKINPARFIDSNNHLGLAQVNKLEEILYGTGAYLCAENELFPHPMMCVINRIDLTKDIYVGDKIAYLIDILNRCYTPYGYEKRWGKKFGNATFTKYNIESRKVCEWSFYDKFNQMVTKNKKEKNKYDDDIINAAKGVLRVEFRIYSLRLKNMKKTVKFRTVQEFFEAFEKRITNIIEKNLKGLFLFGNFYKLEEIKTKIEASNYKTKTKKLMQEFIKLSSHHKRADTAAIKFEEKYDENKLKQILRKFNELKIIPVPIAREQPFDEWSFLE